MHYITSMKAFKNMDMWGTTTSLLCAIHCALLPILLSMGMISAHSWMSSIWLEVIVIGFTLIFVYNSIIKKHLATGNNKIPFAIACLGLGLICIHHLVPMGKAVIMTLGGVLVATAHIVNMNLSQHDHQ